MAALMKSVNIFKSMNNVTNVTKLFVNLTLSPNISAHTSRPLIHRLTTQRSTFIHTTSLRYDLAEFFEAEDKWDKERIKVGRSWRKDELRIKSNEDLHKLWYVLLKERNMLLTMEKAYLDEVQEFPNPERIDKVNTSMSNLESVVRERNEAYFMLETGESGERPGKVTWGPLGLKYFYRMCQYHIPKHMNSKWHKKYQLGFGGYAVAKFRRLYNEKLLKKERYTLWIQKNQVLSILRRFPDVDMEALKDKYPSVNIEKLLDNRKARSHRVPQ